MASEVRALQGRAEQDEVSEQREIWPTVRVAYDHNAAEEVEWGGEVRCEGVRGVVPGGHAGSGWGRGGVEWDEDRVKCEKSEKSQESCTACEHVFLSFLGAGRASSIYNDSLSESLLHGPASPCQGCAFRTGNEIMSIATCSCKSDGCSEQPSSGTGNSRAKQSKPSQAKPGSDPDPVDLLHGNAQLNPYQCTLGPSVVIISSGPLDPIEWQTHSCRHCLCTWRGQNHFLPHTL